MKLKKILAVILAILCIVTPLSVAFADNEAEADCPYIYVHGFMAKDIIKDKNNKDSDVAWPPTSDDILDLVKACLPALLKFLVTKNYDALADDIIEPCQKALGKANLDTDGNASDGSGVYFVYPESSTITKTSKLNFNYDWRLDPTVLASQLNDFIEYVLEASGSEQVVLECHSFGGVVTEAYTAIYGTSRLKSVCYNSSAVFGETYTGDLLSGNIVVTDESLTEFLKKMLGSNEYAKLLDGIFDLLKANGFTGDLCDLANGIIVNIGDVAIKEVLLPMFCGWLSIWAMVPDEYVDSAIDFVFGNLLEGNTDSHKGLYEKITNYNNDIRPNKTAVLKKTNQDCNLYVISRYNFPSVPLTPSWSLMSDSVVDTKNTSFGASCAPYKGSFSEAFVENNSDSEYLSPDCHIYAETCMFPEQTWFIKDLEHSKCPDDLDDLCYTLLYADGQATVDTYEQYPRFLSYDFRTDTIGIDNGEDENKESIFDKIFAYILKFVDLFKRIREFIFTLGGLL